MSIRSKMLCEILIDYFLPCQEKCAKIKYFSFPADKTRIRTLANIAAIPIKPQRLRASCKTAKPKTAAPRGSPRLRVAALAVSQFSDPP